ncbi:hypothetical protein HAX54_028461 [Datura stramonium]|uniref:MADS-box domain-containing protein n=1 Tax=Datura stramonium TaxID=4076 RepID=A0ABS8RLC6_DATST|nr:hypothetical protein [Datura stramonium]
MESKKTRGRQKISMSKIENKNDRNVAFSKRCSNLYKKASELVTLCDVDIGIILSSPAGKPFSFFHPTPEAVIDRFLNPNSQLNESTRQVANQARDKVNQLNNVMSESLEVIKDIETAQTLLQLANMKENGQRNWWESIDQLNADELTTFEAWLSTTTFNINSRLEKLENEASSSKNAPSTS